MRSVAELVQSVITEGRFDVPESQALGWVNSRHELMCMRSRCYRRKVPIGPTVANQTGYQLPAEVMEIREVQVQSSPASGSLGVPYGAARHIDLAEGALHYLWLGGLYLAVGGGIYVRDESSAGQDLLALYPTPTEAGLAITVFAVCRPEPLSLTPPALSEGNVGTFRFCSTTRALTEAERATFLAGGGLPPGVGTEAGVASVVFEYQLPGQAWTTAPVVKDGIGAYHSAVLLGVPGNLLWRAKGLDGTGKAVWQTPLEEEFVSGGAALKIPSEFADPLIDGAIAIGLQRVEGREDVAAPFQARFDQACAELERQVNKRYRGSGPVQIRVAGLNA